jgi:hypothetical protein
MHVIPLVLRQLFPYTALTDWIFITETELVYGAVRAEPLNIILVKRGQKMPLLTSYTARNSYPEVAQPNLCNSGWQHCLWHKKSPTTVACLTFF